MRTRPMYLMIAVLAAGASVVMAQKKGSVDPVVPTHKSELSALKTVKQDARSKEGLKKAMKIVEETATTNEALKKEAERLVKEKESGGMKDAKDLKKVVEGLKKEGGADPLDALKDIAREAKEAMGDESKEVIKAVKDKVLKKKDGTPAVTAVPTRPATFAGVPGPVALNPRKPVRMVISNVVDADEMIKPPSRDPANPDKVLPPSDPRTRTYILKGNARIRGKTFAADGDEIEVLYDEAHAGDPSGGMKGKKGKTGKVATVDPVSPGAAAPGKPKEDAPFERIIIRGRARVMAIGKDGEVQVGRGGYMIYEKKTGHFILREWPEAQTGDKCFAADSKESVILLSQTEEVQLKDCSLIPVEREYGDADFPKTPDKPVPLTNPDRARNPDPTKKARGAAPAVLPGR